MTSERSDDTRHSHPDHGRSVMLQVWFAPCASISDEEAHWVCAVHVVRPKNCVPNAWVLQCASVWRKFSRDTDNSSSNSRLVSAKAIQGNRVSLGANPALVPKVRQRCCWAGLD